MKKKIIVDILNYKPTNNFTKPKKHISKNAMKCRLHNVRFMYACPACETEWEYMSQVYLIDFFRAGAKGKECTFANNQEKAAYERGKSFRTNP